MRLPYAVRPRSDVGANRTNVHGCRPLASLGRRAVGPRLARKRADCEPSAPHAIRNCRFPACSGKLSERPDREFGVTPFLSPILPISLRGETGASNGPVDDSGACAAVTSLAFAFAFALVAVLGLVQCFAGWAAVRRFVATPATAPRNLPPVTILRPLCGDEPFLADALLTCCRQDYPVFQIVFGVRSAADPALAEVRKLAENFPACDISIVVDSTPHGRNRKIANLINMLPSARHDVLVFSDSDLHLAPDYLARLVATLEKPNAGLVTTVCVSRAAHTRLPSRLAAAHIRYSFLPGALLAIALGRRDCLGTTMALYRQTLERSGGLRALADHVADDNVLGQRVAALGLDVRVADTIPAATVSESTWKAMWQHEMRWARTIRALVPLSFGVSVVQYPLCWALLAFVASGGTSAFAALVGVVWIARAATAGAIDHALKPKLAARDIEPAVPVWLLPLRDIVSVVEILASYYSDRVVWRGFAMDVDNGAPGVPVPELNGIESGV